MSTVVVPVVSEDIPAPVADDTSAAASAAARAEIRRALLLLVLFVVIDALRAALVGEKITFLLKEELHLSAGTATTVNLLRFAPVYFQGAIGAVCDLFPIWGQRRRPYFALGILISVVALLGLAALHTYRPVTVVLLLVMISAGAALRALLFNAVLVALGNRTGSFPRLQSLRMLLPMILTASFGGHLAGYVTEHWSYAAAFGADALVTLAFLGLLPLFEEPKASDIKQRLTLEERRAARAETSAALRTALKHPGFWAVVGFVAYFGLIPSPDTARPYFLTDALHLSKQLIGQLEGWSAAGGLIGLTLSQLIPKGLRLRPLAAMTLVASCLSGVFLLFLRDALTAKLMFLCYGAGLSFVSLCYACMMARACARGAEAAVFGLLMSTQSLFYFICDWIGSHIYDWAGPASGHSITHGWYVAAGACVVLTLPGFLFLPFLPKTDPADAHREAEAEEASTAETSLLPA